MTESGKNQNLVLSGGDEISDDYGEADAAGAEAMEKALAIQLIVAKIVQTLDFVPLMTLRRVNQTFKLLSSKELVHRNSCRIRLVYEDTLQNYRMYIHRLEKTQILPTLNEIFVKLPATTITPNFPCNHFEFYGGNLGSEEPQKFFKIFGSSIKTLVLEGSYQDTRLTSKKILREILMVHAPKVENLSLSFHDHDWSVGEDQLFFPSLKKFTMSRDEPHYNYYEFLKAAPNLEECCGHFDPLILNRMGKVGTLKEIIVQGDTSVTKLEPFYHKDGGSQISKIKFNIFPSYTKQNAHHLIEPVSKILEAHKNFIQFIDLSGLCHIFDGFFPKMENTKIITMAYYPPVRLFPPRTNLTETFPNLKVIDWSQIFIGDDALWLKFFPPPDPYRGQLTSVDTLVVGLEMTEFWKKQLLILCPNFKKAVVASVSPKTEELDKIFCVWTHLREMDLVFRSVQFFLNFDTIFTGIEEAECKQLFDGKNPENEHEIIEKSRIRPSILDLTELKKLSIVLVDDTSVLRYSKPENFGLTRVSALYAFRPGCKVTVYYHHNLFPGMKEALMSIEPYISIRDRYFYNVDFLNEFILGRNS